SAEAFLNTTAADPADIGRSPAFAKRVLRRPTAAVSASFLVLVAAAAVFAPIVLPGVSSQGAGDLLSVLQGPSAHHLLGTDALGRDILERILVATRLTMVAAAEAVLVTAAI